MKKNRRKNKMSRRRGVGAFASDDSGVGDRKDDSWRWWVAINGSSVAASPAALPPTVKVNPTPERLLGFRTQQEQLQVQQFLLNAPIDKVGDYMVNTVPAKISNGEILHQQPAAPQPQPKGPTLWMAGSDKASFDEPTIHVITPGAIEELLSQLVQEDDSRDGILDLINKRWGDAAMN
jgi:hypothetical protein